jgi:FlaA1/EpsC-like NDP-sugar epimerase
MSEPVTRPRPRFLLNSRLLFLVDLLLIVVATLGAFALRLDLGRRFDDYLPAIYWYIAVSLLFMPPVFYGMGLYRRMWVYASIQELKLVVVAVTSASVLVSLVVVILRAIERMQSFPRSIPALQWLLLVILIGGVRFSMRILSESQTGSQAPKHGARRVLIVGACCPCASSMTTPANSANKSMACRCWAT